MPANDCNDLVLGKVSRLMDYGFFVQVGNKSGLVHISNIAKGWVSDVEDFVSEGEYNLFKVIPAHSGNKLALSLKDVPQIPARYTLNTLAKDQKHFFLFVGSTGSGKSSLINSILSHGLDKVTKLVPVGDFDSETSEFTHYRFRNCSFIDTPGVGDLVLLDDKNTETLKATIQKYETSKNKLTIIVVLDAMSRDYGSTFKLLENINQFYSGQYIFVLNKVDGILHRPSWLKTVHAPSKILRNAINEKLLSIRNRFSNLSSKSQYIAVSSGFSFPHEEFLPYNIDKLLKIMKDS